MNTPNTNGPAMHQPNLEDGPGSGAPPASRHLAPGAAKSQRAFDWAGQRWLCLAGRLYLGAVFIVACVHKIQSPAAFALDVATYQFLPLATLNLFSLVVPWSELLVGLMLLLGVRVRAAALLASVLMVSFMLALGWALAKGLDLSCGCFASQSVKEQDPISWRTLLRDSAWLAIGLYVMIFDRRPIGIESLHAFPRTRAARQ